MDEREKRVAGQATLCLNNGKMGGRLWERFHAVLLL